MASGTRSSHLAHHALHTASLSSWAAAIQRVPFDAECCLIIDRVMLVKARSSIEPEFLLVAARHLSGAQIVLGVNRNAERPPVVPKGAVSISAQKPSLFPARAQRRLFHHVPPPAPDPTTMLIRSACRCSTSPSSCRPSASSSRLNSLFGYRCYVFARATCLALIDLFGGVEVAADEGRRATWCGVHVSVFSTAQATLLRMLVVAVTKPPAAIVVSAGLWEL
ncbi:hypothetical protein BC826DRAFT_318096 [Russula brevipes]|nr:hypothetical protein BC826DRAFT_318096 [Russula brevipes]